MRPPPHGLSLQDSQALGLVAVWPMWGDDRRELLRGQTLTRAGAPATGAHPEHGLAAQFDATTAYFTAPAGSTASISTDATVSAWVKLRNATPGHLDQSGWPMAFDGDTDEESHYPYTNGLIYTSTFLTSRVDGITPLAGVNRADWHLVTITSRPGTGGWTLYQNAQVVTTSTGASSITFTQRSIGGGHSYVNIYCDGWVADVRLWNRCLSAADVRTLYDPATRWALYRPRRRWAAATVAAGGGFVPFPRPRGVRAGMHTLTGGMAA